MNELRAVVDTSRELIERGDAGVLATVVHVTGSAYRRPGARLLIAADGRRVGSISGGCLEGEVIRKAAWLTRAGRPVVQAYDTTGEDDGEVAVVAAARDSGAFSLGCNGIVQILFEPLLAAETRATIAFLAAAGQARIDAAVITVVRSGADRYRVGDRLMIDARGGVAGSLAQDADAGALRARAEAVLAERRSCFVHLEHADVVVEYVTPPLSLTVFGAGDDARPLVSMASEMGWAVVVADGRPAFATAERFPRAARVVVLAPGHPLAAVPLDRESAVVMMTHNYPMDVRLLPLVLAAAPRYVGLLGPKSRAEMLCADLGIEQLPDVVHAPVGLDIGGDTPAATALAIVAEIQATMCDRSGGHLRHRIGSIHDQVAEIGVAARVRDRVRPEYCAVGAGRG